ncbi:MAG TPA: hypothetical protein VIX89_10840 [Bryobacteraceae bacterium]
MKPPKRAVMSRKQVRAAMKWVFPNAMVFPHELRDAIPGSDLPGCDRALILASVDGSCRATPEGGRVRLNFEVKESGKLTGTFKVYADMEADAARALSATLLGLVERLEKLF